MLIVITALTDTSGDDESDTVLELAAAEDEPDESDTATGETASATSVTTEVTYRAYYSVEELSQASDIVVLGDVGRVVARQVDFGGSGPGDADAGFPMMFVEFSVSEVWKGEAPANPLVVGVTDHDLVSVPSESALTEGQHLVLFLIYRSPGDAPGITAVRDFYVVVSSDNGTFDVSATEAQVRSPIVRDLFVSGVSTEEKESDTPTTSKTFQLSELRDAVLGQG